MNDRLIDLRGYGTVEKWVLINPDISIGAKGLYALICAYAGNKDNAYPSVGLMCSQLNVSKNTLHKYLKELKNNGCIELEQVREDGKFSHNVYKLLPCNTVYQNMVSHKTVSQKAVSQELDTKNNNVKNNNNKNNNVKNNRGTVADETIKNKIDYEAIKERYNQINGERISKCENITSERKKHLNARIKEYGIENVFKVIDNINKSNFLKNKFGLNTKDKKKKLSIDWVISPNNFVKILEDSYTDDISKQQTPISIDILG